MRKLTITIIVICSTQAFAFDPMGPPTARYKSLIAGAALQYSWSELDVERESVPSLGLTSTTIEDLEINKIYGNFGVGLTDDVEIFFLVGGGDADPDEGNDSDTALLLGGGMKFTLMKEEPWKWGLLVQTSWGKFDFGEDSSTVNGNAVTVEEEDELYNIQLAIGPSYDLTDDIIIYGGPFFHWIRGEAELDYTINGVPGKSDVDLEEEHVLGGYIGTEIAISETLTFNVEFQATGAGEAVGMSLCHRF